MADRHHDTVESLADANGAATFTFRAPPLGSTLTGSLCVPNASGGAIFAIAIGGLSWGSWQGNTTFGPAQQWATEQIVVTATGLSPGTRYSMIFIGIVDAEQATTIIWPSSLGTSTGAIPTGELFEIAQGTVVTTTQTFGPFSVANYRTLLASGFQIQPAGANKGALVDFRFFADAALSTLIGTFSYDLRWLLAVAGSPVLADALPVIGPYLSIRITPSNSPVFNRCAVYPSPNQFAGRAVFQNFYSTRNGVGALAAGASWSVMWSPMSPGPAQFTVEPDAAGVAFTLACWEQYYNGGSAMLWSFSSDGTPAKAFGTTRNVAMSTSSPLLILTNDAAGAHDFNVTSIPLDSL